MQYNNNILKPLLSLMALGFIFSALSTVHRSLLSKEMNFKKIAIIEITSTTIGGIIAISMAYYGYGVWSLAWQALLTTAVMTLLFWGTSHWKPKAKFCLSSVNKIMGFSTMKELLIGNISFYK